jgi:FKBP-type peptidyl-prolyl cis-trans isomerase
MTIVYFAFLRNNAVFQKAIDNLGMTTTASGLKYKDLVVGTGPEVKSGDTIRVNYTAWKEDGSKINSTLDSGEPYEFVWGLGHSIPGWEEGIDGMRVGGKRKLVIPPNLAFGETGASQVIGPNETLVFEVELLEIK